MKKFLKPLVIATSVAAVAGIGAVSFAAWQSGTKTNPVSGATTGHVDTTGFATGSTTSLSKTLLPYNQGSATGNDTLYYDIKLIVEGNDVANYEIKGNFTGTLLGKLYYKLDTSETATYEGSDWTELTTTSTALTGVATLSATTYYVHIALDSNQTQTADMDQSLSFSFELAAKS